jgi:hypothetical protein
MIVYFDVRNLYYLPQYLPVYHELKARGADCRFLFYRDAQFDAVINEVVKSEALPSLWAGSIDEALVIYQDAAPNWIVFGNHFQHLEKLKSADSPIKSALLYHGIGVKDCYYDVELNQFDIRFVEGPHRYQEIKRRHPKARIEAVGFAKLDPLFSNSTPRPEFNLTEAGLSEEKPTLLYAPTFYPSSIEYIPDDWPQQFESFNIIIKPHFFTLSQKSYASQRRKIEHWAEADNVYIGKTTEYSLLPFMATADLLISEASSALFEFAALGKPIVWCDFLKLRWSYRGPLRYRFTRRMDQTILQYQDIAAHTKHSRALYETVCEQLDNPAHYEHKRQQYCEELIGERDGKVSLRIADYLETHRIF